MDGGCRERALHPVWPLIQRRRDHAARSRSTRSSATRTPSPPEPLRLVLDGPHGRRGGRARDGVPSVRLRLSPSDDGDDGEPGYAVTECRRLDGGQDRLAWQAFSARRALQRSGPTGAFSAPGSDYAAQRPGAGTIPIGDWQLWTEPELTSLSGPSPRRRAMPACRLSADVVRAEDLERGSCSRASSARPGGTPADVPPRFLDRLYDVPGVEEDFDAVALHRSSPGIDGMKAQSSWRGAR